MVNISSVMSATPRLYEDGQKEILVQRQWRKLFTYNSSSPYRRGASTGGDTCECFNSCVPPPSQHQKLHISRAEGIRAKPRAQRTESPWIHGVCYLDVQQYSRSTSAVRERDLLIDERCAKQNMTDRRVKGQDQTFPVTTASSGRSSDGAIRESLCAVDQRNSNAVDQSTPRPNDFTARFLQAAQRSVPHLVPILPWISLCPQFVVSRVSTYSRTPTHASPTQTQASIKTPTRQAAFREEARVLHPFLSLSSAASVHTPTLRAPGMSLRMPAPANFSDAHVVARDRSQIV